MIFLNYLLNCNFKSIMKIETNIEIKNIIDELFERFTESKKKIFSIKPYESQLQDKDWVQVIFIVFNNYSGNFCRQFLLQTIQFWQNLSSNEWETLIKSLNSNELAIYFLHQFYLRYFKIDLKKHFPLEIYITDTRSFDKIPSLLEEFEKNKFDKELLESASKIIIKNLN